MDNKLEKRFLQQNLNVTPKNILEDLFNYMDEKRIKYEEQEFHYKRLISKFNRRINELQKELDEDKRLSKREVRNINEYIESLKNDIVQAKREIRLLYINCNILWKNELKIGKILGYELEG